MCRETHSGSGYSPGVFFYSLLMGQKVKRLTRLSHEIIWTIVWRAEMVQEGSVRWHPGTSTLGKSEEGGSSSHDYTRPVLWELPAPGSRAGPLERRPTS